VKPSKPGRSAGMTLLETAALMRRLGAVDAVNLDGGGSTTMVARGRVVNRPANARHAQRRVGNALVIGQP
jgi:exopolysaccharide biosynthesis protein